MGFSVGETGASRFERFTRSGLCDRSDRKRVVGLVAGGSFHFSTKDVPYVRWSDWSLERLKAVTAQRRHLQTLETLKGARMYRCEAPAFLIPNSFES